MSQVDELKQLAMRFGLTDEDLLYCYETRDSYEWCLTLLGVRSNPPASPLSPNLNSLVVKLLTEGKIDPQRLRVLGLSKYLTNIIAEKLSNIIEKAWSDTASNRVPELANEIDKIQRLCRSWARVSDPVAEREIMNRVAERVNLPRPVEDIVQNIIQGRAQPAIVAESLVKKLREAESRGEEAVAGKVARQAVPTTETVSARAQAPRGG
jgi:hypothetical protein